MNQEHRTQHTRTPTVSCIMIFLDGERFIDEAIRSVVGQEDFNDWELLLVDDGSSDGSTSIAQHWARTDARIRYLEHDGHENRGMSASRNLGRLNARGRYIGFLDCDDVWLPDKLRRQVAVLEGNPDVDATYGRFEWWFSWTGTEVDRERDALAPLGVEPGTVVPPPQLFRLYRRDPGVVPAICSVLVRREALEAVGGFEDRFRGMFEDQVFYAKMGLHMTVLVTGDCFERYRQHPGSTCAQGIRDRSYHPEFLNAAERVYLDWLEGYLAEAGLVGDEVWTDVQQALLPYRERRLLALARNERWRRSRIAAVKQRVKPLVPSSVLGVWGRLQRRREPTAGDSAP